MFRSITRIKHATFVRKNSENVFSTGEGNVDGRGGGEGGEEEGGDGSGQNGEFHFSFLERRCFDWD